MMTQTTEKKTWISLIAVVAAIGVVYLHVNYCFWEFSSEPYWISANIIENLFYPSVPLFFMITGFTLLDYPCRYSTGVYFEKRIKKTVIPYVFWSIILYLFFNCLGDYTNPVSVQDLLDRILNCSAWGAFWFFSTLFAIYLIIPVFANVSMDKKKTIYSYAAALFVILEIAIPLLDEVLGCHVGFLGYRSGLEGYIAYVLIGYIIGKCEIPKITRIILYVIGAAAFLIMVIGTYMQSVEAGNVVSDFKGYTEIFCFAYALGAFIFLKQCGNKLTGKIEKAVNKVKDYTFGIFLLHGLFISAAERIIRYLGIPATNTIYRIIAPWFVAAGCMVFIRILRSTKYTSWMVPK